MKVFMKEKDVKEYLNNHLAKDEKALIDESDVYIQIAIDLNKILNQKIEPILKSIFKDIFKELLSKYKDEISADMVSLHGIIDCEQCGERIYQKDSNQEFCNRECAVVNWMDNYANEDTYKDVENDDDYDVNNSDYQIDSCEFCGNDIITDGTREFCDEGCAKEFWLQEQQESLWGEE